MKNILLILALLPALTFARVFTWDNSGGGNKFSTATNWSGDTVAPGVLDTVFFDSTVSQDSCHWDIDSGVSYARIFKGWTGAQRMNGRLLRLSYGLSDSGEGGRRDYCMAKRISMDSSGATWKTKYTPEPEGNNTSLCTLYVAKSFTYTDYIGYSYFCQLKTALHSQATLNAAVTSMRAPNNPVFSMGGDSKITIASTSLTYITRNTSGQIITHGDRDSIVVNATLLFNTGASSTIDTIQNVTFLGTGVIGFFGGSTSFVNNTRVINNVSHVGVVAISNSGSANQRYFLNGVTAKGLDVASTSATAGKYTHCTMSGNITIGVNGFTASAVGPDTVLLTTAQITCAGPWTNQGSANFVLDRGTSLLTLNGALAQIAASAGKPFWDITANNTGTAFVSIADSLTCQDLTLTNGLWNSNSYGMRCDDLYHATTDSTRYQGVCLTGDYTRTTDATKNDTSGQHLLFLAGTSHTMGAAGKVYAKVTANAPLTITGDATIALLSYGVDGIPVSIATGTTLTVGSIAGIGGTAGHLDTLQGGTLDLVGNQKVTWQYVDIANIALAAGDTVVVSDGTSVDGGGNTGAWVWPATASGSNRRSRRESALSIGVDLKQ